jgi:hypothetical protein
MSMQTALNVLTVMPTPEQKAALAAQPGLEPKVPGNGSQSETAPAAPTTPEGGVEAKTPEASAPPAAKPTKDLSAEFAALARREKAIVQKQKEAAAREKTFAEREAAIKAREEKLAEADKMWNTDLFKSLEARGLDYNKITKMYLEGQAAPPKAAVDPGEAVSKALADFEKKQAEKEAAREAADKKSQEERAAQDQVALQQAYEKFKGEVATHIKTNENDYELINLYDQADLVVDTIQQHFDNTQNVLSIKEASEMVEKYLEGEAQKALKSKKLGAKAPEAKKEETKSSAPTKTLTNQLTPTMSSNLPNKTENDRMARALAKLK